MWVRKRLDIGWGDLLLGLFQCGLPRRRSLLEGQLANCWESRGFLPCLSVRSGLDLLLGTLAYPAGSEVLLSALTIPDMAHIVQSHGLTPVPLDLDFATAGPTVAGLRRAISPASRAILVAHLFGGRVPLEPALQLARQHKLLVIEDCAQAFDGPRYAGHPEADVSLFSFGPIKTATALCGAMLRVHDPELLDQLRDRQAEWPIQTRRQYLARLLKYLLLKGLSSRLALGAIVGTMRALGRDYDRLFNGAVRGFPGPAMLEQIRRQPSTPLLAVLLRRLRRHDPQRLARRTAHGRLLAELLAKSIACPGLAMESHSFWVFPIVVEEPRRVIAALREAGFDATQGQSMCVVPPPSNRPELVASQAANYLAKMVYLPNYPELPETALGRMAQVVLDACRA